MPGPNSFTGEDVAEFQFHGSTLIAQRILRSLYTLDIRAAEPGEFSKRAFLNGKLDLLQAEAIADLISATSDRALSVATEQLQGRLSRSVSAVAEPLRQALTEIEASLDFAEEEIEPEAPPRLLPLLQQTDAALSELIQSYAYGHIIRDGFRVLIAGRPNAGKSSLLNALLQKPRAIVTPVPGTTRDLIEESLTLQGYRLVLCDSAGITETTDQVEAVGVSLAKERLAWADLVLYVVDANAAAQSEEQLLALIAGKNSQVWLVLNKIDLVSQTRIAALLDSTLSRRQFAISAVLGSGLTVLKSALIEELERRRLEAAQLNALITNERHRSCFVKAQESAARAAAAISAKLPAEIVAAEMSLALSALEEIVGKTTPEEILNRIFSKFCIGK